MNELLKPIGQMYEVERSIYRESNLTPILLMKYTVQYGSKFTRYSITHKQIYWEFNSIAVLNN